MKANLTYSIIWPRTGDTLTQMCSAPPKSKRPLPGDCDGSSPTPSCPVSNWGHLSFWIASCPLRSVPEEMGHRAAIPLPRATWHFQIEGMGERGRWRDKNREIISQGCFDFQKRISVYPDKILAAGGTTLDRNHLLEQEGAIRSQIRETLMNTDRPQSVRMWFTRCFEEAEGLHYMVRRRAFERSYLRWFSP